MNTPVLVFANVGGRGTRMLHARHAVSSSSRCCGSISLTSRADNPKNGASNPLTSSMKPARRVTTFPGAPGSGSKNSSTSHRSRGYFRYRVPPLAQQVPVLVRVAGAGKAHRVADYRKRGWPPRHLCIGGCHALSSLPDRRRWLPSVPRPRRAAYGFSRRNYYKHEYAFARTSGNYQAGTASLRRGRRLYHSRLAEYEAAGVSYSAGCPLP